MMRRTIQISAWFSLAICLLIHLLWLRSHFGTEELSWSNTGGSRSIGTAAGHLELGLLVADWSGQPATQFQPLKYEREPTVRTPINIVGMLCSSVGDEHYDFEWGGLFWHAKLNFKQDVHNISAAAPCWLLAFATMLLPIAVTIVRLRKRTPDRSLTPVS